MREGVFMLAAMYVVAILVEIGLPLGLALIFLRRYRLGWGLVGVGVLTFIGSQVVHLPLLYGLSYLFQVGILPPPPTWLRPYFNPILLGLLAGLCEETARWVGYRLVKQKGNSWGGALTMGIGHGGIESTIVGVLVLVNFVLVLIAGPNGLPQLGISKSVIDSFWSTTWYMPLAGGVERITAVTCHLFMSVLVWQAVSKRNAWWYVGAVFFHAALDGVVTYFSQIGWSAWGIEAIAFGFMIIALFGLWWVNGLSQPEDEDLAEVETGSEPIVETAAEAEQPPLPPAPEA
jgi:uncharacterized membrane protein YhfC